MLLITFTIKITAQCFQLLGNLRVQESISISSHQHDEIKAILQLQVAKPFPDLPLDTISLYCLRDILLGYDQAQPGIGSFIGLGKN